MAICVDCEQEMQTGASCTLTIIGKEGVPSFRIRHASGETAACHDCNTPPGGLHHLGCDAEVCPECGGQLIACGCWDDDDE